MPRAGDNIFLFLLESRASQRFRVYQRGESLPDLSFPDTVKETRSSQPLSLALPLDSHLPPRQQIRHARPAQRTAARGAALYTGDASAAGGVGCGNGRMATRRVVAHRTAGGRHVGCRCALAPDRRRGQRGRSESIVEFDLGVSKVDDDESGHWSWIA